MAASLAFQINLTDEGKWVATVLNGGPTYHFQGVQHVEAFAQSMAGGNASAVIEVTPDLFLDEVAPQVIYSNLLLKCDELFYFNHPYVCETAGDKLDDEPVHVGLFLLYAMAMMTRRLNHVADREEKRKMLASLPVIPCLTSTGASKSTHSQKAAASPEGDVQTGPKTPRSELIQARHVAALAATHPDFSIAVTNWTQDTFVCADWAIELQPGTGDVVQTPPDTLRPSSESVLSWHQPLIQPYQAMGENVGWAIYQTRASPLFAVRIAFPFQIIGIGPTASWEVATDGGDWIRGYPNFPHTFDTAIGYSITCMPQSFPDSLYLGVSIKAISKNAAKPSSTS